ncbi:hypothetical protein WN944_026644 [Citrus x changshan-huyou]|uniref:Uncharacterized protein n=1 Tax=Citrus x changshan-huyou TaxID=2935761 RepID=A0AAP0LTD5_9ROSI
MAWILIGKILSSWPLRVGKTISTISCSIRKYWALETIFRQADNQGSNELHLTAKFGDHRPWFIHKAALQIQWEINWYQAVDEGQKCMVVVSLVERDLKRERVHLVLKRIL